MKFAFTYQAFEAISDEEVYAVFRRMNSYSTPLNPQELRNGRYFGPFRQSCDLLAREHYKFWKANRIFTEKRIARMSEVQLTSALLVCQVAGMQDLNRSINDFYNKYDETFPSRNQHEKRFRATIEQITSAIGETLPYTHFRSPAFFYTLFGVVFHRLFRMPGAEPETPERSLREEERESLRNAVVKLSEFIEIARDQNRVRTKAERNDSTTYPAKYQRFIAASLSQTDNIKPRTTRFTTLYREAFG
jgi:hypothetical protein